MQVFIFFHRKLVLFPLIDCVVLFFLDPSNPSHPIHKTVELTPHLNSSTIGPIDRTVASPREEQLIFYYTRPHTLYDTHVLRFGCNL